MRRPHQQHPRRRSAHLLVGCGHVNVAHEDGVAEGEVVVERLGEVKAQALKQVGLERHWRHTGGGER